MVFNKVKAYILLCYCHCPIINTATTHIGSSISGKSYFVSFWVTGLGQSKGIPDSPLKPILPLFRAVVLVIHLINVIIRLIWMCKMQATHNPICLHEVCSERFTQHVIYMYTMIISSFMFDKHPVAWPYEASDVLLKGSSGSRSQMLACSLAGLW